jgi:hypothetical protein
MILKDDAWKVRFVNATSDSEEITVTREWSTMELSLLMDHKFVKMVWKIKTPIFNKN